MKGLLCLLAVAAAPLFGEQWPLSPAVLGPAAFSRQHPRIAASANGFLAAWSDFRFTHDVWGTRLDAGGHVLGPVHIAAEEDLLAIASDGDGYLAVVTPPDCSGIDTVHIDRDGVVSAPVRIPDVLACAVDARVASNGSSYLVIYGPPTRYVLYDRDGRRLRGPLPLAPIVDTLAAASNGRDYLVGGHTKDGASVFPIGANGDLGAPHIVGTTFPFGVALASDGDAYMLLLAGGPVRTQRLDAGGAPAGPLHTLDPLQAFEARLVWSGSEYIAAWTGFLKPFTTTWTFGRIAADGAPRSSHTAASQDRFARELDFASSRGATLLVRESGEEMYAAPLTSDDVDFSATAAGELLSRSATPQLRPRMAALPSGAAIAWNDGGRLYARLLEDTGHPFGAIVDAGFPGSIAHDVVFDGTNIVVATLDGDSHAIFAQRFTTSLEPVDAQPLTIGLAGKATNFALAGAHGASLFAWTDGKLFAAMLAGAPIPQHAIASDNDQNPPAATWDGSEFLVAYSSGTALSGVKVDANGNAFGGPRAIARIDSPAARSAVAPAIGGVFAAWKNYGVAARIFGARSDPGADGKVSVLSAGGVVEGPFLAGNDVVGWTMRVDGGLQLQWRGGGDAAGPAGADAGFTKEAQLAALEPSLVEIGARLFAAYEHYDEDAGGVPRIYIHPSPLPRHRAARR